MHQDGFVIQSDKLVQFLGILERDAISATDRHLHVVHAQPLHNSSLVESAIFASGTDVYNRDITSICKYLERLSIRLSRCRNTVYRLYLPHLDNCVEVSLERAYSAGILFVSN